jgi:lipoprotein-anchoring transpeptidase ErfK/SrfK
MGAYGQRWIAVASIAAVFATSGIETGFSRQPLYRIEKADRGRVPPLVRRFTATQIALLEKLNRADVEHLDELSELVVPESWPLGERSSTTLPLWYAAARSYPKLVVVYVPGQVFGAYESGDLVRWGPVSTGARASQTRAGWFHLNWRATGHVSTVNPEWYMKWYFNLGNKEGLAFHEYELPGHPASHGCVRLLGRDAQWLFDWGQPWTLDRSGEVVLDEGTPVLISGTYDFAVAPPWRSLAWLATPITLPAVLPPPPQ